MATKRRSKKAAAGPTLSLTIANGSPVAVADFTVSLEALAAEYRSWLAENPAESTTDGVALYVREPRKGSLVADLVALQPLALNFVENAKTVIAFAKFLKVAADVILGRAKESTSLPRHTYENVSKIVEPVAKDSSSQLNVSTTVQGEMHIHLHLTSVEANAAQNASRRRLAEMRAPATGLHERVVLYLHQARNDPRSSVGDRAVIESIAAGPVKVVFANEATKKVSRFARCSLPRSQLNLCVRQPTRALQSKRKCTRGHGVTQSIWDPLRTESVCAPLSA